MGEAPLAAQRVKLSALERLALLLLLGTLAVLGLTLWGGPSPAIPPAVIKSRDSLAATAPAFDSTVATTMAVAERHDATDRRLASEVRALRALDDTLRHRTDSLALDAHQHADSALAWRAAYEASALEAASLRAAATLDSARIVVLTASRDSLRSVANQALLRLDAVEQLNAGLEAAIVKATECRWGGPLSLPCPSRKQTAIGSLVLSVAGVTAAR